MRAVNTTRSAAEPRVGRPDDDRRDRHNGRVNQVKLCAPLSRATIHTRMIGAMVLVAAISLLTSGAVVLGLELSSEHRDIDARLQSSQRALAELADTGVDPVSGQVLDSPNTILEFHLSRTALGPAEGEVGFIDGRLRWLAPPTAPVRIETDQQLIDQLVTMSASGTSRITSVATQSSRYRVLLVPVTDGTTTAVYVRVVDLNLADDGVWHTMRFYAVAACGAVALACALAWFAVGRLLRPIGELRQATQSIDERDLTTRVTVRGRDDLSLLAEEVNRMLDRVQSAVESQRALMDDVGHELRTPLTIVRGHLELIDAHDPEDVSHTTSLTLDELDRMGGLVDDLLVLARSEQSDFVTPIPTDIEELTLQVLDKSQALGERRWNLSGCACIRVVVDPARITQAWLQIVSNAVKYSSPGSTVTLGSQIRDGQLLLSVADEGIGIAPEDLPLVRRRFGRTAQARNRASGSGLGLSIVETIVGAHGGCLDIESSPGRGSVVTLHLPTGEGDVDHDSKEQDRP